MAWRSLETPAVAKALAIQAISVHDAGQLPFVKSGGARVSLAEQRPPAVALSAAGDLVVAWTGGEYARYTGPGGSGTAVYARRYPAAAVRTTSLSTR